MFLRVHVAAAITFVLLGGSLAFSSIPASAGVDHGGETHPGLKASSLDITQEVDTAVAGTPPTFSSAVCNTYTGAKVCFDKTGDDIWVLDTLSDGHAARADWGNYLWDGDSWQEYRWGDCTSSLKAGNWGVCRKDFYENTSMNAFGSRGSYVGINACETYCNMEGTDIYNDA